MPALSYVAFKRRNMARGTDVNAHAFVASVIENVNCCSGKPGFHQGPGLNHGFCTACDRPAYMRDYMKEYRRKKRLANPLPVRPPFDRRVYMKGYMKRYRARPHGRLPARVTVAANPVPWIHPALDALRAIPRPWLNMADRDRRMSEVAARGWLEIESMR